MLHAAHPTDIPGLLHFAAQTVPNLACPRRCLGEDQRPVWAPRAILAPVLPHRGVVHVLLLTQGRHGAGLAALRGQRGLSTWEVDLLLLASGFQDTCTELLARLDTLLLKARGERAFLRLADESPALDAAREVGYHPYLTETLYYQAWPAKAQRLPDLPAGFEVRPRRPEDDYPLFRLYTASTPVSVRSVEGLTFREWQEASIVRWQGGPSARDLVVLQAGTLVGLCRAAVSPDTRTIINILTHPQEPQAARAAVLGALRTLSGTGKTWVLAPEHAGPLQSPLEEAGFLPGRSFTSLVHQVGVRLAEPALAPA